MKKVYIITVIIFNILIVQAQRVEHADEFFEEMNYVEAAKAYDAYITESNDHNLETLKKAGDANYFINDSQNAYKWYHKLYNLQKNTMDEKYFFRYIQSLKGTENYTEADALTKVYLKKYGTPEDIEKFLAQKKAMDNLEKSGTGYQLFTLRINSENSDFGPAFYGDQLVYSSSKQNNRTSNKRYAWNQQPFLNLYIADRTKDGGLINEKLFMPDLPTRYHDATIAFSKNLDTIYYTTNFGKKSNLFSTSDEISNLHIMRSVVRNGKIIETKDLYFNSTSYSVGHPALSDDGKYLYFVSDMPGGYGSTDIYRVAIVPKGGNNAPENLGPVINTKNREMFPFYRDHVLYFSSDGHYGLGGLDIFKSKNDQNLQFSTPENLGKPLNSNKDDFSYILAPNLKEGFMASNRDLGKGDDDIYYFTKSCFQFVTGKVIDSLSKKPLTNVTLSVIDVFQNEIKSVSTNEDGDYVLEIPCDNTFKITATKSEYTKESKEIKTRNIFRDSIGPINFSLSAYDDLVKHEGDEDKIKIEPLFFDFNKYAITVQAAQQLDHIKYVMQNFPELEIKIESHTDSRGSDSYNLKLSQKRAEATRDYLISHGVAEHRILSARGYGETEIRNKCVNGVPCSDQEHEENRRSDFIVVKNNQNSSK